MEPSRNSVEIKTETRASSLSSCHHVRALQGVPVPRDRADVQTSGTYDSTVGGIKETVGNLVGSTDTAVAGKEQKAAGDAQYKAAQAQGYAEGTKDRVAGKVSRRVFDPSRLAGPLSI